MTPTEAFLREELVAPDVPAVYPPADLMGVTKDVQARPTILETSNTRGLLGKLFGKGTVAALLLSVLLISGTAWAAGGFGSGNISCGQWTESKEADGPLHNTREQWVLGYLSAYSRWVDRSDVVKTNDGYGATVWIDNFCRDNPFKYMNEAAEQLIYALEAR